MLVVGRDTDDLDRLAGLDDALLDAAGRDGAAAGDREDVLDRHQERLVELADRLGDVVVERCRQLEDLLLGSLVTLERLERRAGDERNVVARELVGGEQLADLDLDQLEQLVVIDHVRLVEEHDDVRHADLARQQDVLACLGHRAVGRGDDEDRAVHLRGAGDHVLDVVGVTGAIDVGVMAILGLVLDVSGRDRDPALALLGSVVDRIETPDLPAELLCENGCDGSGQRRLAVVDVTDRADIDVRLVALELRLCHFSCSCVRSWRPAGRRRTRKYSQKPSSCADGRALGSNDSLASAALHHPLGDVRRHFLVAVELHRVGGAALRV